MSTTRRGYQLLDEYIQWVAKRQNTDHHYQVLFRGVSSVDYDLQPAGWREGLTVFQGQDDIMREFLIDHLYAWAAEGATINPGIKKLNLLELMALAQHYGFPTYLLDWATNPMIALLFSILKTDNVSFTKIKHTNREKADIHSYAVYSFIPEGEVIHANESIKATNGLDINTKPLLYRPPIIDNRIRAQSGVFTYHHASNLEIKSKYKGSILQNNENDTYKVLDEFSFSPFEAVLLRELLLTLEYNNFKIMPDLEGLSAHYKNMMRQHFRSGYLAPKHSPGGDYLEQLKSIEFMRRPL